MKTYTIFRKHEEFEEPFEIWGPVTDLELAEEQLKLEHRHYDDSPSLNCKSYIVTSEE